MRIAILLLLAVSGFALERPGVEYKIFQFPADKIPRIDGDPSDWSMVPESYAIGMDQLKETVIAVSVFGRPTDYDPKADTVVRNQALRLRLKLKDYYESEGARDPLMIQIPKGQYAPRFVARTSFSQPLAIAPYR